jgi:DNA-binding NarL/FixJ family response regulator
MDGISRMKDSTITQASLFLVIPDEVFRQRVVRTLPACYEMSAFTDIASMLAAMGNEPPELIICHQQLIEADGSQGMATLTQRCASSRILVVGPPRSVAIQIAVLKQGARGYFNQELPLTKLHEALQLVIHGEVWVERQVISGLIDELSHMPAISEEQQQALQSLSPKELDVAKLVSHGATNKMIAKAMNITERTVKAHLTAIFQKMNLADRLSLAIFFRDLR